jgi:GNAT superfamily N-acetyltransferase
MKAKIREASRVDIDILIQFQQAMASETELIELDNTILRRGLEAVFDDPTKGRYLVVTLKDRVVGCLMLTYEWSDWRNGTVLWIQSVYIDLNYRGKGLYKKLYQYVKDTVSKNHTLRGIRLYVDKRNEHAQKVYEKLDMNGDHYQVYEWMK